MSASISEVPERSVTYLRRDTTESRSAMLPHSTPIDRFWAKVNKDGPIPEHAPHLGPCWIWTGAKVKPKPGYDYGSFGVNGRSVLAHRYSWELEHGEPVPEGKQVCHHCDNPPCVRANHLFIGTNMDNVQDAMAKGRFGGGAKFQAYCKRGHEMTPENRARNGNSTRCRICRNWYPKKRPALAQLRPPAGGK